MHNGNAQSTLKIHLGGTTIDPRRVWSLRRIGSRVCLLKFITGETLSIVCGVEGPETMRISFPGHRSV